MEETIWELFFEKCRVIKIVGEDHSSKWADMTKSQEGLVQGLWLGGGQSREEKVV